MNIFGVSVWLDGDRAELYKNDMEFRRIIDEKTRVSMLRKFEDELDNHLQITIKETDFGTEIAYSAGFVDRETLVENSLFHMGLTSKMVDMLKEEELLEKFTHKDLAELEKRYDNGIELIEEYIKNNK